MKQFKSKYDSWSVPTDTTDKTEAVHKRSPSTRTVEYAFESFAPPDLSNDPFGTALKAREQYYLEGILDYGESHCGLLMRDIAATENHAEMEYLKYHDGRTTAKNVGLALQRWVELHKELSQKYQQHLERSRKEVEAHG